MHHKITQETIRHIYKRAPEHSHKGSQGHALLIGGSYGKIGAPLLAAKAALRTGCGLVTAFVPGCGYLPFQSGFPEAMVVTDANERQITDIHFDITPQAIGAGPGMGQELQTQRALHKLLETAHAPLVLDADALNILALNLSWLQRLPPQSILTPHPKELERLIGPWKSDAEKFEKAQAFAKNHQIILISKGAPTYIFDGASIFENTTGNPALATAGSGDVLTGILTSLRAQGYAALQAAQLGVFLHGRSADLGAPLTSREAFIASDIIAFLGRAFLSLPTVSGTVGFK